MIISYLSLRHYGINIFDYAKISDFLLAAFHNPLPILSGIFFMIYMGFYLAFARRVFSWQRKVKIVLRKSLYKESVRLTRYFDFPDLGNHPCYPRHLRFQVSNGWNP
jgi:hypothetical protein